MMTIMLRLFSVLIMSWLLTGCITNLWTGASLIYDRHHIYLKIDDFQLAAGINRALYHDKVLKRADCQIEIAVFNRDVLLVGHVPTESLRREVVSRVQSVPGKRRVFNQIDLSHERNNPLLDSWITSTVRGHILANSAIDPHQFKIVTSGCVVYLMGDVIPDQAKQVILYARQCRHVKRVVKLLRYYNLSDTPSVASQ